MYGFYDYNEVGWKESNDTKSEKNMGNDIKY